MIFQRLQKWPKIAFFRGSLKRPKNAQKRPKNAVFGGFSKNRRGVLVKTPKTAIFAIFRPYGCDQKKGHFSKIDLFWTPFWDPEKSLPLNA